MNYVNYKGLSTATFSAEDIGKIIQNLDSNKAHGHDNISIPMLKTCDPICIPLQMIFKQTFLNGAFPSEWKKGNGIPIYKERQAKHQKFLSSFFTFDLW